MAFTYELQAEYICVCVFVHIHMFMTHTYELQAEIMKYFEDYSPKYVLWLDDSSGNVVFNDPNDAKRALCGYPRPHTTCLAIYVHTHPCGCVWLGCMRVCMCTRKRRLSRRCLCGIQVARLLHLHDRLDMLVNSD
jgi:hypothetical protein